MKDFLAFMKKYYPDGSIADSSNVYGYSAAQALVQILKQCGDNLTRENVMRQAANLKNFQLPLGRPGIAINTSPTDFQPFKALQLQRFDGKQWVGFDEAVQDVDQLLDIRHVQADRRLVEDIERVLLRPARVGPGLHFRKLRHQLDALRLAAGERRALLTEREVAEAHVLQQAQAVMD